MHALTRRGIGSVPNAPLHPDHPRGELRAYARVHFATASSSAAIAGLGGTDVAHGPRTSRMSVRSRPACSRVESFYATVDTLVMSRATFDTVSASAEWPFADNASSCSVRHWSRVRT